MPPARLWPCDPAPRTTSAPPRALNVAMHSLASLQPVQLAYSQPSLTASLAYSQPLAAQPA